MELKPVRDEWAGADTETSSVFILMSNKILGPRSKSKYILDLRTPAIKISVLRKIGKQYFSFRQSTFVWE